ncbi:DUF3310 domain-containing protein [Catenibacterium sp.]|uniref:DUF3310 domain-containing protein n=1 Tax=Catenibacterium sp. TaxID=2049022 RepID=UPI003FD7DB98
MASKNKNDQVNHPKHYTSDPSGIECIDITRHRNFNIGNAIKYLWRAGLKEDKDRKLIDKQIEDLNKAVWYLVDEIHRLGSRCTVKTDSINTCLPIDNESIIDAALNYHEKINGQDVSILGLSNGNGGIRFNIADHLKSILLDLYHTKVENGGQTKRDM